MIVENFEGGLSGDASNMRPKSSGRSVEGGTVSRGLGFIVAGGQEGPSAICILGTVPKILSHGESIWVDGVEI